MSLPSSNTLAKYANKLQMLEMDKVVWESSVLHLKIFSFNVNLNEMCLAGFL